MAPVTSGGEVAFVYDKKAKEKVRKCGGSAKRKAVQLGKGARVFSAVIHFNPTYGKLDGAVYVPQGESIPDVNQFLAELANGMPRIGGQRRATRRATRRRRGETITPESSHATMETSDNKFGELAGSVTREDDASAAEAANANDDVKEIAHEEPDAPHDVEAIDSYVADFGGLALDAQKDDAGLDEDPMNPAQHELSTETCLFSQNLNEMTAEFTISDANVAGETNAAEEVSFMRLLEVGMHDMFDMDANISTCDNNVCLPTSGPVDNSGQGECSNDNMTDWEMVEMQTTLGATKIEETADTHMEAPGHDTKSQKTPTAAGAARVCRPARNTKKIHRFFWQVSQQIRHARRQRDPEMGHISQTRLGVKAVREVRATVQSRGNQSKRWTCNAGMPLLF
ncbi:uncharacterized protein CTRU02_215658 [Colletotrichum truncatum]|uniref:Uncharacterized protein n=1 Tax=Colletotrichum truncatum TaxID=5467 RepID=A0ACC3YCE9_COLTU|nr:uncharacterized protein CTRU02_05404 [Colletotrichum truncatum]KAF6793847.1 hypothetical protein CTRU02_05404 [Colletotrichum truncatum]